MKGRLIIATALLAGATAMAGVMDDVVFSVNFAGDSLNDTSALGGGLSSGTGNSMTFADISADGLYGGNGRGAVFNGSDSYIDYNLGAGNELKIEGSLTYHIRVKFDTLPSWHFLMGRWGGDAANNRVSTILGGGANCYADASTTGAYDSARRRTTGTSPAFATDTWYDIFYRFQTSSDGVTTDGFHHLTVYETGDLGSENYGTAYQTAITGLYDTSDVLFRVGASRHTAADPHAPIDGTVDQVNVWNRSIGYAEMGTVVIPEPATMGLVGVFGAAILAIRRKMTI